MILGPADPRAIRKGDPRIVATGSTLADFDTFLDTDDGQALIERLATLPTPRDIRPTPPPRRGTPAPREWLDRAEDAERRKIGKPKS